MNPLPHLPRILEAAGLDYGLDTGAVDALTAFIQLRARWAQTHNISGPMALETSWSVDVPDSVAVASCLDPDLMLYDVGAGSGIPGFIVGILEGRRQVRLVEPRAKRAAFMRTAIHELGLPNVRVLRGRWPLDELEGPAQVVSRAVVGPEAWPELAARGGSDVKRIIRMLAANRPGFEPGDYCLAKVLDYDLGTRGLRRIEAWHRTESSPPESNQV
jgi:16S rRNA G527 N7-methylase RsmG